ncbi:hypothetical protein AB1Y20_006920 [Prymnesium parvum]|uniref:N-alpha-acetyltransferase 40 n=1 Tax=Prymnesium parvum TaxID=97485 RepID=A0AB34IZS6_PRYPA
MARLAVKRRPSLTPPRRPRREVKPVERYVAAPAPPPARLKASAALRRGVLPSALPCATPTPPRKRQRYARASAAASPPAFAASPPAFAAVLAAAAPPTASRCRCGAERVGLDSTAASAAAGVAPSTASCNSGSTTSTSIPSSTSSSASLSATSTFSIPSSISTTSTATAITSSTSTSASNSSASSSTRANPFTAAKKPRARQSRREYSAAPSVCWTRRQSERTLAFYDTRGRLSSSPPCLSLSHPSPLRSSAAIAQASPPAPPVHPPPAASPPPASPSLPCRSPAPLLPPASPPGTPPPPPPPLAPSPSRAASLASTVDPCANLRAAARGKHLRLVECAGGRLAERERQEALSLVRANMSGYADWEERARLAELTHSNTRLLLLRSAPAAPLPAGHAPPRRLRSRGAEPEVADGSRLVGFASFRFVTQACLHILSAAPAPPARSAHLASQWLAQETLAVVYLLELQLEPAWRRQGLGSELLAAVVRYGEMKGRKGLLLTVALANHPARAFYSARKIEVSPVSPARCAPPSIAAAAHHELRQYLWSAEAEATMEARGAAARKALYEKAVAEGSLTIRLVRRATSC